MLSKIKNDIINILTSRLVKKYPHYGKFFNNDIEYHINPTGKFVIGGPHETMAYQEERLLLHIWW